MNKEEWEAKQKEREQKQKEWDERQREREKKQKEYEERLKLREQKEKEWEKRVNSSKSHLDTIMSMARVAEPYSQSSSAFADVILAVATGGLTSILQSLLGERDSLNQRSSYLSSCANKLKQAIEYLNKHKDALIGEDRAQAYAGVSSIQEKLNAEWAELKDKKQKVNESLKRAREEKEKEKAAKQAAWEERQRVNAEKQRLWEEKKKANEERQKIKDQKQKEWEARQKEKDAKQKEWESRQKEREARQKEYDARQREREREKEQKQREYEERQRERERRQSERQSRPSYGGGRSGGGSRSGGGGKGKGGCYLTTACVTANGLSDDCYELKLLRSFRDNYLLQFRIGKNAVAEYYKLAPFLVDKINKRKDADTVWDAVYQDIIVAVQLIEEGNWNAAFAHYKQMTYDLAKK